MITINFSHHYKKMPAGFERSRLLEVIPVRLEAIGEHFREYDTTYIEDGEEKHYFLPATGDYMILLLLSSTGNLWTTIRSSRTRDRDKLKYYRGHIGEVCNCQV